MRWPRARRCSRNKNILAMKPILVTCYMNPDLDGVAGVTGYAEFLNKTGRSAVAGIFGQAHEETRYLLDRFKIKYPLALQNSDDYDEVVLVDASEIDILKGRVEVDKVVEVIDHRQVNEANKFLKAKIQIEAVGSAATLVAERFTKSDIEISKEAAILIYGAIISNTLNFQATVTTERDRQAAKWVNNSAQLPEIFWEGLFVAKSDMTGAKLTERMYDKVAVYNMGGKKLSVTQIEMIGAGKLIEERKIEIIKILNEIKKEKSLDIVFLNLLELKDAKTFLVADDENTKELVEKILSVKFAGQVAERSGLIMRKQIIPLLKEELEK